MNYERLFQGLAVILLLAAGFLLWREQMDAAFVSGVLAASAFFIGMRVRIKDRIAAREENEVRATHSSDE